MPRSIVALACAFAVGGCFDDPAGLYLVVHDTTGRATKAELFFGAERCEDCGQLAPPSSPFNPVTMQRVTFDGTIYLLDGADDEPTARSVATFDGGAAPFRILPRDGENVIEPKLLAIVTSNESGIVGGMTFDPGTVKRGETMKYRLDIDAVDTPPTPSNEVDADPARRILQWDSIRAPETDAPCTMIEDVHDSMVKRSWFVPPNDHDCDGIPDGSDACPSAWNGDDIPPAQEESLPASTCPAPAEMGTQCRLGAYVNTTCGGGPTTTCNEFGSPRYCVDNFFCSAECRSAPLACMDSVRQGPHSGDMNSVQVGLTFDANTGLACGGTTTFNLGVYLATFYGSTSGGGGSGNGGPPAIGCTKVEIWDVLHHREMKPAAMLDLKNSNPSVSAPVTVHVVDPLVSKDTCTVQFEPKSDVPPVYANADLTWAAALDITIKDDKHLVLPVYFVKAPCNGIVTTVISAQPDLGVGECISD